MLTSDHIVETDYAREDALRASLWRRGYVLLRLLGEGAFSRVFLIKKEKTGETFACKISGKADLAEREGKLLKLVRHPLFPKFYEMWTCGSEVCIVMEYVCGANMEELLRRRGPFSQRQTARIGIELAEGLGYLHRMREPVLFRDVKPANIVVRQDGRVRLLDMGCARAISKCGRERVGTPGFAAPEQLSGELAAVSGDVYSLGMTLSAIAGKNSKGGLDEVIRSCTEPDIRLRPPDMRAVVDALAPLCGDADFARNNKGNGRRLIKRAVCENNIWESMYRNL